MCNLLNLTSIVFTNTFIFYLEDVRIDKNVREFDDKFDNAFDMEGNIEETDNEESSIKLQNGAG